MAGFIVEYRPVYQRHLKVYRGIDNDVQFRLINADQKPINTTTYTPKFLAFDENNNLVIEHDGTVQDDGSSSTKGLFYVTITENDLLNIKSQYLKYVIYLVDSNNSKTLTYTDEHFDAAGIMYVDSQSFPGPRSTYSVTQFQQLSFDDMTWVSETLNAEPAINGNEALHTAAIYTDGYTGNITIQATLENQITGTTDWADIETISFTGTESEPTPINFNGVFSYLRFKTDTNPANTITKILVRN
jgi:hypothetical protein